MSRLSRNPDFAGDWRRSVAKPWKTAKQGRSNSLLNRPTRVGQEDRFHKRQIHILDLCVILRFRR